MRSTILKRAKKWRSGTRTAGSVSDGRTHDGIAPFQAGDAQRFLKGQHRFIVGVLKGVHCDNPALSLTVTASGKELATAR